MANSNQPTEATTETYEEDYAYYDKKKKSRMPRRRVGEIISTIVILAVIILLLLILLDAGFRDAVKSAFSPEVGGYREYPEWAEFEVEREITVTPRNRGSPMNYEVDIPTPQNIGSNETIIQSIRGIEKYPTPYEDTKDYYSGNYMWMFWNGSDITSEKKITIVYSMRTENAIWTMDSSDSGSVNDYSQNLIDKFGNKTRDEWKILPTDPEIKDLSNQLTGGKVTVYDKLWAIFDYMNDHFEYVTSNIGEPKVCYQTLKDRFGDCDDQSVLFISLARAAGIPCKLEFGALYNQKQEEWGGHAWIKTYIPHYSGEVYWYNIDIVNDHFLFRDSFRFTEWESDGNGDHLEDYYYLFNGSNYLSSETYTTLSLKTSSKTTRISEEGRPMDEKVPGFEGMLVVSAILITALILRRKKHLRKR
ncbi:MAG: transglutaminase family protein [Thermoplasmata archaeon]|nr:MAG: transglutaminase family protein [Thermoplasmata archaeon]